MTPPTAAVLPFLAPQPTPVGLLVLYVPPGRPTGTVIVREFGGDDAARCSLCPAELCRYTPGGSCAVYTPELVDGRLAALYRLPG